jgi:hypothetical protein
MIQRDIVDLRHSKTKITFFYCTAGETPAVVKKYIKYIANQNYLASIKLVNLHLSGG